MATRQLLADLNPEQRAAATHRAGPLLVIAGAGTGKTTVISRRIAWLVEQKLAQPSEILALTFTEKAAGEMEARVDQLLPYGLTVAAISTFHAFGDQLLREHALDVGLPPEFRVMSGDEQELFLAERIDAIEGLNLLRPMNNPAKLVSPILKVISRAKDELVSPERYAAVAQKLLRDAKNDEEQRAAERQREIAIVYAAYETLKAGVGVIDFGDQMTKVVELLDRDKTILKRFRSRFRFILVDEFQDTNIAQFELVRRLLRSDRNLTVVGDDDQAIYKFRGAAIANILNFLHHFPDATQVVLRQNYRSTQAILNTAYRLIQGNNPDRLESTLTIDKRLQGRAGGDQPVFHWYSHDVDELDALAEHIKTQAVTTPLPQIAILVRTNALLAPIAAALTQADVPYARSSDAGFVHLPEVRGVIAFFQSLVHPDNSLAHLKLAFSPFYNLKPEWILAINDVAKKTGASFDEVLHTESNVAWSRLPEEGKTALTGLRDDLSRYRVLISHKNPGEILYQFLKDRGALQVTGHRSPVTGKEKNQQPSLFDTQTEETQHTMIQNLAAVFDAIKRYAAASRDQFVPRFVDRLEELLSHIVPPRVDLGPDVPAVQILTVHAAKGLEFEVVCVPFFTADRFPARRKYEPLALPDALIAETLPTGDEHLEEERRLAYVALTRAKSKLYLSGSAVSGESSRVKRPSPFVFEALGITQTPPPISRVSPTARMHDFAPHRPAPATLALPTYDGLFFLSPAMIETYQNDPYQFYWRYVLKAPQEASRHLSYGNAIHAGIEAYHRLRISGKNPTVENVIRRYEEAWKSEGFRSQADEERQLAHGKEVLKRFFARAEQTEAPSQIEETITLLVPGARIRGRIDAIYESRGEIRDFKTSDVRDQKDAEAKLNDNIPLRIYALAYRRRFGRLPKRLVLDFVEKDLESVSEPTERLVAETEALIAETIAGIKAGRFDPNPQNPFKDYE